MQRVAGRSVVARALELWGRFRAASVERPHITVILSLLFFVLTVLVYYFTNSEPTAYNTPVRLADGILHGRLDIANAENMKWLEWAPYKGKYYPVDPPFPAIVLLPGVVLFGLALNQTLVSIVIGGIVAASVFRLMRGLTEKVSAQVWLTLLFVFGTIFWWAAASGANWHYSHTVQVLFLFLAIHETVVAKRPFWAGLFLGAAYWSRLTPILALPFFAIMFSDQWLPQSHEKTLPRRIDIKPILQFGSGVGIFLVLSFIVNYLEFDTPLPASRHYYFDQWSPRPSILAEGLFDITYIPRHLPSFFRNLPIFQSEAPYVLPSWSGMAIWATTPPFVYALFAGFKTKSSQALRLALLLFGVIVALVFARGMPGLVNRFSRDFPEGLNFPYTLEYLPFILLVALAVTAGFRSRDRLVLACWSAIIPIALVHFTFFSPPPQFGYQYALDYYPFLFLLTWAAIGDKMKWHHMLLIVMAIIINLWAVLWIYQFDRNEFLGLQWVRW